ncbi:bifunctional UDP-N-acetylglucosamine diphosphorylase/glucosamine-1-phosphate N-acetyltransferase GlmU [Derxia gummosa]|uniref:Bifunctional protein GlmU n=1 Tax=Derxia gummosa DSM 723 TaxID=1121388 RepID=A0A8B6X4I2_9BURK|nr:bifunctional UDP-N-acetylglucosamine diphosphorylase/glucosamine-1-phosphate N-acetyltransferase GlmU [Derxia gummosa]
MNIVVLAAGRGKRMHSDLPKVLHTLAGKPLLGHVLDTARGLAPGRLAVVIGHGGELVRTAFDDGTASSPPAPGAASASSATPTAATDPTPIRWAIQAEQLGTGHAVMQALPELDDAAPTLVLYGDVPLTRADTLLRLVTLAGSDKLAILTAHLGDPTGYGRIVREGGAIARIVEHKDASPDERAITEINTGVLVVPTPFLRRALASLRNDNAQGEYYLTDVIGMAVAEGIAIESTQPDDNWEIEGVNSRVQLATLERVHQHKLAADLLERGVALADPARIDVRGTLVCGRDVFIDVGCVFEGAVSLADGVRVGPYAVLRNVTVGAGTRVDAFCHLEDAAIGASAVIGPYARLRPGTKLSDEVHIGNFVEVKNGQLGHGSKANHLSYIGDATVGARVNIGAGTITCNYDGANKHRTVIEDDVHIGSDTQLVAPVTVGAGSTVAAGTTVWRDTPANALILNGKTQVAREGWQRPVKKKG